MKHRLTALLTAITMQAVLLPAFPAAADDAPALLDASKFNVQDENIVYIGADYLNAATVLFNDQDKVPASPENTKVDAALWEQTTRNQNWKPNWQSEFGDDVFYVDLGANYMVTGLCFLDTNGVQDWTVEDGEPFDWQPLGSFTTDAYNTWRGVSFEKPRQTRYLRFTTACGDSGVSELAIYGTFVSELTDAQKKKDAAHPSGSKKIQLSSAQQIGFNAFIDDPMTAISAGGNVREYHNFSWLLAEDGSVKFTQGTWGDMDSYYAAMKAQNISIIPCFQGGSSVISGEKPPEIPVPKGADTTDPASYAVHAQAMYQVAARYGSNTKVDPKTLNVADGSEPKTGLGLLQAAENCNEPNKTWSGKANFFSPFELAAMCSADYDGHEGTIPNAGVKQADPDFQLAMGGMLNTASLLDYLSQMKLWFDYHRTDGKFAVDIINVHMGPDTCNPEDSSFVQRVKEIQRWIFDNAPGTALWISEFEIPMSDCEKEGVDAHDDETYQLRYAQRLARTYLAAIGAGVDRMTKFQLRDEGEGVYYNSGLVTQKGTWRRKPAWYFTSCMTTVLQNTYFAADLTEDEVKRYFFINNADGSSIYGLWLPTSEGKTVKNYSVAIPGNANVYLTEPGEFAEGKTTKLPVRNGAVTLDVGETPVFLTITPDAKPVINGRGQYIRPQYLSLTADGSTERCDLTAAPKDSKLSPFYRMFDEPDTMPEYVRSDTAELSAPETAVNGSGTCYVSLGRPYALTGFGVFDTYGTGSIEIYDARTDKLLWSSDLGSYMSRSITMTEASAPTDLLKIVKGGGEMNELAIYGDPAFSLKGDVNGDGVADSKDVRAVQQYLLRKAAAPAIPEAADFDCDGKLTAMDLSGLKQLLA